MLSTSRFSGPDELSPPRLSARNIEVARSYLRAAARMAAKIGGAQ